VSVEVINHNNNPKRRELDQFCDRYISFWLLICLAAFFLIGWPMLLAWIGIVWGMRLYKKIMLGEQSQESFTNRKKNASCK